MTTKSQQLDLPKRERIRPQTREEQHEHGHDGAQGPITVVTGGETTNPLGSAAVMGATHHPQQSLLSHVWHFVRHFVEMCLAMCIGGITLNVLFFLGAAQLGYADLVGQYPEFSILMIGILLAIPMAAWMRFRGHEWRTNLEMSSTSIMLAILLIGAAWLGVIPKSGMLEWMTSLACPVMIIPMLFRLDLYTADHAAHARHALPKVVNTV
jgi:hypothetical protein